MLKLLAAIIWGASIMVFVGHLTGYLMEGRAFLKIPVNTIILGFIMLASALIIWEIALLLADPRSV